MADIKEKYRVERLSTGKKVTTDENLSWLFEPSKGDAYYMVFFEIVHNKSMLLTDLRVYAACCQLMKPGGWVLVPQKEIAEITGINKGHVNASMKKLLAAGYLFQGIHPGTKRKLYQVNSFFACKGSLAMRKAQAHIPKKKERTPLVINVDTTIISGKEPTP